MTDAGLGRIGNDETTPKGGSANDSSVQEAGRSDD
jgi:hypothetical protein